MLIRGVNTYILDPIEVCTLTYVLGPLTGGLVSIFQRVTLIGGCFLCGVLGIPVGKRYTIIGCLPCGMLDISVGGRYTRDLESFEMFTLMADTAFCLP